MPNEPASVPPPTGRDLADLKARLAGVEAAVSGLTKEIAALHVALERRTATDSMQDTELRTVAASLSTRDKVGLSGLVAAVVAIAEFVARRF